MLVARRRGLRGAAETAAFRSWGALLITTAWQARTRGDPARRAPTTTRAVCRLGQRPTAEALKKSRQFVTPRVRIDRAMEANVRRVRVRPKSALFSPVAERQPPRVVRSVQCHLFDGLGK